jgi:hypothetical protein
MDEAKEFADINEACYLEITAKDNEMVRQMFSIGIEMALNRLMNSGYGNNLEASGIKIRRKK